MMSFASAPAPRLKIGRAHVVLSPEGESRALAEAFLADPAGCLQRSAVCKRGSRGYAVRAELAGRQCFLKHYRPSGPGYRLLNALRRSRAMRTWTVSWQLLAAGVQVPRPLFCVEERVCRLLGDAYLATEFVADALDLFTYWKQAGDAERQAVLQSCAAAIGNLHAHGWCHGDLKWRNLMIRTGGDPAVVFVDVDAARRCRLGGSGHTRADLQRFMRDLGRFDPERRLTPAFVATWERIAGERPAPAASGP